MESATSDGCQVLILVLYADEDKRMLRLRCRNLEFSTKKYKRWSGLVNGLHMQQYQNTVLHLSQFCKSKKI
jgi:hypothetical protein